MVGSSRPARPLWLLLLLLVAAVEAARQPRRTPVADARTGAASRAAEPQRAPKGWAHAPSVKWTVKDVTRPRAAATREDDNGELDDVAPSARAAPPTGRGRAAKRERKYEGVKFYAESHLRVLAAELDEERTQARERLEGWGRERLAREGATLFELSATAKERLYADRVVRLDLRGFPLPFHRFASGDLVAISPSDSDGPQPPARGDARGGAADDDAALAPTGLHAGLDGVVLSRSARFIDVCVRPRTGAEANALQALGGGGARWRLDGAMSAVPYDRMALALATFTAVGTPAADADALRDFVLCTYGSGGGGGGGGGGAAAADGGAAAADEQPPATAAALKPARAALDAACAQAALDESQRLAVRASFARQLSLVQGPPGTGKTRVACAIALATRLAAKSASEGGRRGRTGRSLLCAPSNVAADNLLAGCLRLGLSCVRLGRPAYARADLRHLTLDARVLPPAGAVDERAHVEHMRRRWRALEAADVVVGTATGVGELLTGPMATAPFPPGSAPVVNFDLCLVDESSQCIEPAVLLALLSAGSPARLVLVGDQCQLGPVLLSDYARKGEQGRPVAAAESLFARLVARGFSPRLLAMQYRMPAALAEFSAGRFYAGKLKTACADDERPRPQLVGGPVAWPHATLPLLFVDTLAADALGGYHEQRRGADTRGTAEAAAAADGASGGGSTSYRNRCEARLVDALVRALIAGGMRAADIGVVTPYAAQVRAISDQLGALAQPENAVGSGGGGGATDAVEVSSVDGFQGREKEAIVLSAVRSNAAAATGFLKDWRRLNVSITRARCALIVVGDSRTLQADPHWRAFIAHARKGGGYVALPAPRAAAADAPAPN